MIYIDPYRFGSIYSGLWAAYGITQVVPGYAGSVMRVRRSSDNTEQDIGLSGTALDTASLTAFVGGGNGFVRTWYDQSGGGHHAHESTNARQPSIVTSGVVNTSVYWYANTLSLVTTATLPSTSAITAIYHGGFVTPQDTRVLWAIGANPGTASPALAYQASGALCRVQIEGAGSYVIYGNVPLWGAGTDVFAQRINLLAGTAAAKGAHFKNGAPIADSGTSGTTAVTTIGGAALGLGVRPSLANDSICALKNFLLYTSALSDSNIATISALL